MERIRKSRTVFALFLALIAFLWAGQALARIEGVTGNSFSLTAKEGRLTMGDGLTLYAWGYANGTGAMQYPGITMIVNQGETVTVTLKNELPVSTSIVFPGQQVTTTGGSPGVLTTEANPGETVTYSFIAANPGTYLYYSGTMPEVQAEMGLVGVIIVRPYGYSAAAKTAYGHQDSQYDIENLFFLTEMDPRIHDTVESGGVAALSGLDFLTNYSPVYWFVNGRNGPDTMFSDYTPWLPNQPYGAMAMIRPGDRLLMRVVNAGRDFHPFHMHGNNATVIAKDGRLRESASGAGADLGTSEYTLKSMPGETMDAIFEWTGQGLGWDMYGPVDAYPHTCTDGNGDGFDDTTKEYCADHGKAFPVSLPGTQDITIGGFYSGSPYLGVSAQLPPGQGGLNPMGAYLYMWHSHAEKEMANNDIFPGGMMTMIAIVPPGTPIE